MASITLRSTKGSPLTNAEVDANFSDLNTEVGTKVDQAGARSAISVTGSGSYSPTTGVIDIQGGVSSVAGKTGVVTLTKADVGLSSVDDKSSATIRGELTSSNVTTALGYSPYDGATNPSGFIDNNGNARVNVKVNGTSIGVRRAVNFVGGTNVTLAAADSSASEEVSVTVSASGGGGPSDPDAKEYVFTAETTTSVAAPVVEQVIGLIPVATGKTVAYQVHFVVASTSGGGETAGYIQLSGLARNTDGVVTDVGSLHEVVVYNGGSGITGVDCRAVSSPTPGVNVWVYHEIAQSRGLRWRAHVRTVEAQ